MFKKIVICLVAGLILTGIYITASAVGEANKVKNSVLRLHVVANSNSAEDQELKLKVRDAVLKSTEKLFAKTKSREEAIKAASDNTDIIKEAALKVIHSNKYNYDVNISVGRQYFPTKTYEGGFRLPAGEYDAVKVVIGNGEGKNWWCVMYPPLCFSGSVKKSNKAKLEDVLKDDEIKFVSYPAPSEIEVKFKIAEVIGEIKNFFEGLNKK